jgi:hypothetical protein
MPGDRPGSSVIKASLGDAASPRSNKAWAMSLKGSAPSSIFPASGGARAAVKYANEKDKLFAQFQMIEGTRLFCFVSSCYSCFLNNH